MAFIPDEAERRCDELSGKEWKLATLYYRMADRHGIAWPSLDTIARERGWTKSNACKARLALVQKGWLRFIEGDRVQVLVGFDFQNGNETVSEMEIELQEIVSEMETEQQARFQNGNEISKMETPDFQNGNANFQNGNETVSKMEIAYKEEPAHVEPAQLTSPIEPEEKHAEKPERYAAEAKQVFQFWQAELSHPKVRYTPDKADKIRARLREGYTVEELKMAIRGCRASPYHQGENSEGKVYDSIELIFRNGSKVDQFIGYAEKTPALARSKPSRDIKTRNTANNAAVFDQFERDIQELYGLQEIECNQAM